MIKPIEKYMHVFTAKPKTIQMVQKQLNISEDDAFSLVNILMIMRIVTVNPIGEFTLIKDWKYTFRPESKRIAA